MNIYMQVLSKGQFLKCPLRLLSWLPGCNFYMHIPTCIGEKHTTRHFLISVPSWVALFPRSNGGGGGGSQGLDGRQMQVVTREAEPGKWPFFAEMLESILYNQVLSCSWPPREETRLFSRYDCELALRWEGSLKVT